MEISNWRTASRSRPLLLSTSVANHFEIDVYSWMDHEGPIVSRVIVLSQARWAVAGCTRFESCSMELFDFLSVCNENC
jgi:hypothetical protein